MKEPLVVLKNRETADPHAPTVAFHHLAALWVQITGTWCNLECVHCINASGPNDPWLKPLDATTVRHAIREALRLGVKEIYFTGGEPFLHREILALLSDALAVAPTTVLTNGTAITEPMADALAALASRTRYSLEIRVSLDDVDREENDRVRGEGAWAKAVRAIERLHARGLLPIVTATEITSEQRSVGLYERFRDFLIGRGIDRPRVKIMPVFALGRQAGRVRAGDERLTAASLEGFDTRVLQCADTRVVADGGVYACPILAGLEGARLSSGSLEASFQPARLYHAACVTCHRSGMSCRNA
jgi:MoaA/NifB/PqqE/SkfB family radical SAM enzyme